MFKKLKQQQTTTNGRTFALIENKPQKKIMNFVPVLQSQSSSDRTVKILNNERICINFQTT